MDTFKIEMLLRAIELGSLARAAEEFSYTPSALSHIVDSIEDEIGSKIIKRTYSGVEIEEGHTDTVKKLEQLIKLKNEIIRSASVSNTGRKTITIATYASLSKYILPRVINNFKKTHTNVDINIIVADKLDNVYKRGAADLLFGERIDCSAVWEELIYDPYVAVLPKTYCYKSESIARDELLKNTFVMAKDARISEYVGGAAADVININSDDDSSVIQLVKEGMCVSVLPRLAVRAGEGVKCMALTPEFTRVLGLMYDENDFNNKKYLREFIEYFRLSVREEIK